MWQLSAECAHLEDLSLLVEVLDDGHRCFMVCPEALLDTLFVVVLAPARLASLHKAL